MRLNDGEAIVDNSASFVLLPLLACRVFRQDGIGFLEHVRAAVEGAERDVSDRAGEGLDWLPFLETNLCHDDFLFDRMPDIIRR